MIGLIFGETNFPIEILKKIQFLLKEEGYTVNGVKKLLQNDGSFNLDEKNKKSINLSTVNLKSKLERISNLVKEIKKLG